MWIGRRSVDRALAPRLRFGLTFALVAAVGLAVYFFPYPPGSSARSLEDAYLSGYAHVVAAVLRALGSGDALASGQNIGGHTALRIVRTCDAADVLILLVAAVIAWPAASVRRRFLAACTSVAALSLLNVIRICTLYWTGAPVWLHVEVWPALMIAAAGALFFLLLVRRRESEEVAG